MCIRHKRWVTRSNIRGRVLKQLCLGRKISESRLSRKKIVSFFRLCAEDSNKSLIAIWHLDSSKRKMCLVIKKCHLWGADVLSSVRKKLVVPHFLFCPHHSYVRPLEKGLDPLFAWQIWRQFLPDKLVPGVIVTDSLGGSDHRLKTYGLKFTKTKYFYLFMPLRCCLVR